MPGEFQVGMALRKQKEAISDHQKTAREKTKHLLPHRKLVNKHPSPKHSYRTPALEYSEH